MEITKYIKDILTTSLTGKASVHVENVENAKSNYCVIHSIDEIPLKDTLDMKSQIQIDVYFPDTAIGYSDYLTIKKTVLDLHSLQCSNDEIAIHFCKCLSIVPFPTQNNTSRKCFSFQIFFSKKGS
jgi:hypothetical protein